LQEKLYRTSNYYPGMHFTIIKSYTTLVKSEVGTMFFNKKSIS